MVAWSSYKMLAGVCFTTCPSCLPERSGGRPASSVYIIPRKSENLNCRPLYAWPLLRVGPAGPPAGCGRILRLSGVTGIPPPAFMPRREPSPEPSRARLGTGSESNVPLPPDLNPAHPTRPRQFGSGTAGFRQPRGLSFTSVARQAAPNSAPSIYHGSRGIG